MRLRLAQREHLDERLDRMLTSPAPDLLATSAEHRDMSRIKNLEAGLERLGDSQGVESARARTRRLKGVLLWQLDTHYHERLTDAHDHLRQLNAHVDDLSERYDAFVRTRQAATHSYVGYGMQIEGLRNRAKSAIGRLDALQRRQGHTLERVAIRELELRRGRLEVYQNKARFAFADSYDRAAKAQAR
jgi:chromosome segregation ATPase